MMCPKCEMIEMRVKEVKDDTFYLECRACGTIKEVPIEEIETNNEENNEGE